MNHSGFEVYEKSIHKTQIDNSSEIEIFMVKNDSAENDFLVINGKNPGFIGKPLSDGKFKAPLNHENAQLLKKLFPFTAPESGYQTTIEEHLHATGGNSAGILFKRTFYFRVGNNYGLMRVFAFGDDNGVQVTYMLNTTPGDHNLETGSQGDVNDFR